MPIYWAPTDWMDTTHRRFYYSKRGWRQKGELRMRPWENARLEASYFGVIDRESLSRSGPPIKQGGHEAKLLFTALLPAWVARGCRSRSAHFAHIPAGMVGNFVQAVNSEVRNTAFFTNNFRGFQFEFRRSRATKTT